MLDSDSREGGSDGSELNLIEPDGRREMGVALLSA
jgi:hypothetical protein